MPSLAVVPEGVPEGVPEPAPVPVTMFAPVKPVAIAPLILEGKSNSPKAGGRRDESSPPEMRKPTLGSPRSAVSAATTATPTTAGSSSTNDFTPLSTATDSRDSGCSRRSVRSSGTGRSTPLSGRSSPRDSDYEYSDDDSDTDSDYSSTDSDDEDSENKQACMRIFEHIDADGSGLLELEEVLGSWEECTRMGLNPNATSEARKVKKMINAMDADGSGALDVDEFCAI